MAAQPASTVPTISPAEMQILISRSGLMLNPGQMADLVLAWRQVAGLIAAIPQARPLADDSALSFRLPGPAAYAGVSPKPAGAGDKPTAKGVSRLVATPKAAGKGSAHGAAKAAPRTGGQVMPRATATAAPRAGTKVASPAGAKAAQGAGAKGASRTGAKATGRTGGKSTPQPRVTSKAATKAKASPTRQAARQRASSGR